MKKIKPIQKGHCSCCADNDVYIRKCKVKQCDYTMCNVCYKKYYETNTLCPACRNEIETNLCNILTNYINSNREIDIELGSENRHAFCKISCNCLNNFNCYCIYDQINRENSNYRIIIKNIKNCIMNLLGILFTILIVCLSFTLILAVGRTIYLFTVEIFVPGTDQTFLTNDAVFLLLSCVLGIIFGVLWIYCLFCSGALIYTCSHSCISDDGIN